MDHIGIDLHTRESQICIVAGGGELIERRIRTDPRCGIGLLGVPGGAASEEWQITSGDRAPERRCSVLMLPSMMALTRR